MSERGRVERVGEGEREERQPPRVGTLDPPTLSDGG
jgi:hypothetical protein